MFTDSFDVVYGWYDDKNNEAPEGAKIISKRRTRKQKCSMC